MVKPGQAGEEGQTRSNKSKSVKMVKKVKSGQHGQTRSNKSTPVKMAKQVKGGEYGQTKLMKSNFGQDGQVSQTWSNAGQTWSIW
jgi:hypothetical protein